MFELACERDLEGIVAKHRVSKYLVENGNPGWVKIKNRNYSQLIGRDELFERRYEETRPRLAGVSAPVLPPSGRLTIVLFRLGLLEYGFSPGSFSPGPL